MFFGIILPELITRKNCPNKVHDNNKFYCICKRPSFPPKIACDGKNCHIEWFNYSCVKISRVPREKLYCNNCLGKEKLKVLILYLVNYFVSFSVLIYEIPLIKRLFWQIPHKATWKANIINAKAERFFGKNTWLKKTPFSYMKPLIRNLLLLTFKNLRNLLVNEETWMKKVQYWMKKLWRNTLFL